MSSWRVEGLRRQYHLRKRTDGLFDAWDVHKLIKLTEELPTIEHPLGEIAELDEDWWFQEDKDIPTPRTIEQHIKMMEKTDLNYPIILSAEGRLMDGMHRVLKALHEGHETIAAKRFEVTPLCDHEGVNPRDLDYE